MVLTACRRPRVALIVLMLELGVRSEFSLKALAWKVYHGAGIAIWQGFQKVKQDIPEMGFAGGKYIAEGASYLLTRTSPYSASR